MSLFDAKPLSADPVRTKLDAQENNIAGRLSKLTSQSRDDVLNEAYRRARLLEDQESYRRHRS